MPARPEFTPPCEAAAYAPNVVMTSLMERTVEHLVLNIAVVIAFFLVVRAGLRLVDRF
jgi:hypothetical protein